MKVLLVKEVAVLDTIFWLLIVPEPVLLLNTTALVSAVQVADKVTFAETVPVVGYVTPAWKTLVPSDQPAKVKPDRVNVFAGVVKVPP